MRLGSSPWWPLWRESRICGPATRASPEPALRRTWAEVDELARGLGVECLTRRDGPAGKAGNLKSALRRTSGEFVLTIDADHLAHPDFLDDTLGWFTESDVAFVATPQAFQVEADDPFNNAERFFYDFLRPAKDRDSAAFSCGNGSVYRRGALADIGGFSEWNLVEDLHTSYCLHAAGGAASITLGRSRWEARRLFQPCTSSSGCDGRLTASGCWSSTVHCSSPGSPWRSAFNASIPRAFICSPRCSTSSCWGRWSWASSALNSAVQASS
ncbi:MAG TPA: glycosyltransferase [Jiangellaceae bacterium]|nr:glycosyltransferase [Jiangellaceae bacterium]